MSDERVKGFHISEPEWFDGLWWACLDDTEMPGVWSAKLTRNGVVRDLMWFARRRHEAWPWDWTVVWAPGQECASVRIRTFD